jgi:hypothetical protein
MVGLKAAFTVALKLGLGEKVRLGVALTNRVWVGVKVEVTTGLDVKLGVEVELGAGVNVPVADKNEVKVELGVTVLVLVKVVTMEGVALSTATVGAGVGGVHFWLKGSSGLLWVALSSHMGRLASRPTHADNINTVAIPAKRRGRLIRSPQGIIKFPRKTALADAGI